MRILIIQEAKPEVKPKKNYPEYMIFDEFDETLNFEKYLEDSEIKEIQWRD
jgi:hypothetical protein